MTLPMVAFSHKNTRLYATNYDTLWNTVEPEAGPISNWRKNSVNTKSVLCCSLRQNVSMRKSHSYTPPPLWKSWLTVYISQETESSYTLAHRRESFWKWKETHTHSVPHYIWSEGSFCKILHQLIPQSFQLLSVNMYSLGHYQRRL